MKSITVSETQAAKFIGVIPRTLSNWRYKKKGPPYIKVSSGRIRYFKQDLIDYLNKHRIDPSREKE